MIINKKYRIVPDTSYKKHRFVPDTSYKKYRIVPDTIQDVSVWKDSDVDVVDEDRVKLSGFFVPEKSVRHPNFTRIRQCQILHSTCNEICGSKN